MRLYYCGFNVFNQWESGDDHICNYVKEIKINENFFPINGEIDTIDIHISWSHNLYLVNNKIFIRGFHLNNLDVIQEIVNPRNDLITNFVSNDDFILLYNTSNSYVWKYYLSKDMEEKWKLLPNFIRTDQRLCLENEEETGEDNDDESIIKIVSSARMNVALSNKGRLFNIPYEINCNCIGKIIDIACGHEHGILLTDLGNVYTWGGGSRCQLGHGNTDNADWPEIVEGLSGIKIVSISAGGWHCCVISEYGDLYTWGWNERGQLGIFNTSNNNSESKDICDSKLLEKKLDTVIPEAPHPNKIRKSNNSESLPVLANYALPVLIDIYDGTNNCIVEKNVVEVNCGSKHTVIKLDDGTIWSSGCNKYGQLGFDSKIVKSVSHFTKLDVDIKNVDIKCGTWATAFIEKSH